MKAWLLGIVVLLLFGGALYGLFGVDAGRTRPSIPPRDETPPVDHIDDSSRDALLDILREENGEEGSS